VEALERVMPPPDLSKLTDSELEARVMCEVEAWRVAEMRALADPSSTTARRTQAEDALRVVAEMLA
jgi:hypothetical protein